MLKMLMGYKMHTALLSRLNKLIQQRSFYAEPCLTWVTRNYQDAAYLSRLKSIAPAYGVKEIVPDDENLKTKAREDLIDAVGQFFGRGGLPYLAMDRMIAGQQEYLLIDDVGKEGETLGTWGNVYAVSYSRLTGERKPETVLADYCRCCFGDAAEPMARLFSLARKAIKKSFYVFGCVPIMDESRWPCDLEFLNRMVEKYAPAGHPLREPGAKTIGEVDFEKIEALEAAHDAWTILEEVAERIDVKGYLWLEHYLHHLKVVCQAIRVMTVGYFKWRANAMGTMKIPDHVFRAIGKDLFEVVCDHKAILAEFEKHPYEDLLAIARQFGAVRCT
jgi:hypothetical protein